MLSKKEKNFFIVFVVLILLFAVIGLVLTYTKDAPKSEASENAESGNSSAGKLQICPDAWYSDQMPKGSTDKGVDVLNRQYFVIDGERKEMAGYDLDWIRANCLIKGPVNVY